ncbi:hypothetical protein D0T87_23400 [Bacteroides sp. 51]|nr:hypothetical protein [Bacteroides sp. 51]
MIIVGAAREPPNAQNIQKTIFGRFANRPYSKSFTSKPTSKEREKWIGRELTFCQFFQNRLRMLILDRHLKNFLHFSFRGFEMMQFAVFLSKQDCFICKSLSMWFGF